MKKKILTIGSILLLSLTLLTGCGGASGTSDSSPSADNAAAQEESVSGTDAATAGENVVQEVCPLEDGTYEAEFNTDSGMFKVNEACDGKGILTVENGTMTIHISLVSQNIVNLYPGLKADAQADGAVLLEPTVDTVTYSDGDTDEVYGFDVPVPALNEEFDLALIGTHGNWYDHKVIVSNPVVID